jgi:predicted phosphodiesterase
MLRRTCAFALAFLGLFSVSRAQARVLKGPWIQDVTPTGAVVRVEIEPPAPLALEATREGAPPVKVENKDARALHSFTLQGLEPEKRYAFTAGEAKGSFVTAPKNDSTAPFTFLLYGDNRSDPTSHAAVVRAMLQVPSDFLVHTGDFVADGGSLEDWATFFTIEQPLLKDRALFSCVGNHELFDKAGVLYTRYFGVPSAPKLYGTSRWGSVRFFYLNAFHDWKSGEEREWLEKELAVAKDEAGLAWRIAVMHQGIFAAGPHGGSKTLHDGKIGELLAKNKVDLVLAGHDHIYERGDVKMPEGSIKYLVSGGGGAPLYRVVNKHAYMEKAEATHHFVEITVAREKIAMVPKRIDGTAIERCAIERGKPGWVCEGEAPKPSTTTDVMPTAPPSTSKCGCHVPGAPASPSLWPFALLLLRRRRA